ITAGRFDAQRRSRSIAVFASPKTNQCRVAHERTDAIARRYHPAVFRQGFERRTGTERSAQRPTARPRRQLAARSDRCDGDFAVADRLLAVVAACSPCAPAPIIWLPAPII